MQGRLFKYFRISSSSASSYFLHTFRENLKAPSTLANTIKETQNKTEKLIQQGIEQGVFYYPQIRKRSYRNTSEYVHFLNAPNSFKMFTDLIENNDVIYHARITGRFTMWTIAYEKIEFENSLIEGYRTDYHFTKAPNQSWDTAIEKMHNMIDLFDISDYRPTNYLKSHLDQTIYWPPVYDILFQYFKFNLRKPLTPLMKDYKIPLDTINQFLGNVDELFTTTVAYYPGGIESYEPWLFKIETDYEDFIIDLFSELPTTSLHFKVKGNLFSLLFGKRELLRNITVPRKIEELHIPWMMDKMREKGIITHDEHGLVNCHWKKIF